MGCGRGACTARCRYSLSHIIEIQEFSGLKLNCFSLKAQRLLVEETEDSYLLSNKTGY